MKFLQSIFSTAQKARASFLQASLIKKIIITIILVVAGWYGYSQFFQQSEETVLFQTSPVEKGTIIVSVTASGQVSSTNNATVNTQSSGVVSKIYASNGTYIKAGDPIAEITLDQSAQQKYTQALASYQSAQNNLASAQSKQLSLQAAMFNKWDTFKELAESGTYQNSDGTPNYANRALAEFHIPEKEWLAAEADFKNQTKAISQAQTALSSSWLSLQQSSPIIYAPISGTVTGFSLQVGSVIASQGTSNNSTDTTASSKQVASIFTTANPTVTVNLTEIDVTKVAIGDKVTVTLDAFIDITYTGKVLSIDTVGSVSSGVTNYPTVVALDVQNTEILPNMSASATIITDTKHNVLMVPISAVQTAEGESTIRVMKNGVSTPVTVTLGLSSDTQTEIISGLSEGDEVITSTTAATSTSTQTSSPFSPFGGSSSGGASRMNR